MVLNARTIEHIPAVSFHTSTKSAAYVTGKINGLDTDMLLDSGASCSVVRSEYVLSNEVKPMNSTTLINADGSKLPLVGTITAHITLNDLDTPHTFIVVDSLSSPVILGCDFLLKHHVTLNFGNGTFHCESPSAQPGQLNTHVEHLSTLIPDDDLPQAMPFSVKDSCKVEIDMPQNYLKALESVLKDHEALFRCQLGKTNVAKHVIDTGDAPPVKLPSRPIPFHYTEQVQSQLKDMVKEGIIRPSNSPWCAPAVYVPKSNGEVRICVDFVHLNKVTKKDSYTIPRTDGLQAEASQ